MINNDILTKKLLSYSYNCWWAPGFDGKLNPSEIKEMVFEDEKYNIKLTLNNSKHQNYSHKKCLFDKIITPQNRIVLFGLETFGANLIV